MLIDVSRTVDPVAHAAPRESFVDAAESLMRERGYAGLTIGDVIAAAGGSKGGFYHYFRGKQELLAAVVLRMTGAAKRIHALGVANEPLPLVRLTAASLGERLRTAVRRDRVMQDSARALAAVIDGQDGYVEVVRHLEPG